MPFHGVGFIVGGTIAVLGSGYAFKKFVYDPHLAHLVEAFIAQHPLLHSLSASSQPTTEDPRRGTPIPVPVSTSGTSSARQSNLTHLRRRRSVRERDADGSMELETRQPLLRAGEREDYYLDANELDDWSKSRRATIQVKPAHKAKQTTPTVRTADCANHNLFDLHNDPPPAERISEHASEIRSIIFDRDDPPATTAKTRNDPVSGVTPPDTSIAGAKDVGNLGDSTSSEPRSHPAPLSDSWSMSIPDLGSQTHASADSTANDMDIIRPGTAQSDYVDAESYTPFRDGASPTFPAFPLPSPGSQSPDLPTQLTAAAVARHDGGLAADMGMSFVRLHTPAISELALSSEGRGIRRGPMSVVSLSESDGGGSEEDWEAI